MLEFAALINCNLVEYLTSAGVIRSKPFDAVACPEATRPSCSAINSLTMLVLYGLSSGAALATVVGVLIEIPVMLMLVKVCLRTHAWLPRAADHT
jgi:hypothetical protein